MTLQQEIIQALGAKPQIDVEAEIRRRVDIFEGLSSEIPFY